ncbi:flotillin family protein [Xylanimonas sp. McL0601]|uniref:flotillin family protein n=1 Tax=Xylanimonas sp. McL0601 TaxID=3414739 RepID=UPI003CEEBBF9
MPTTGILAVAALVVVVVIVIATVVSRYRIPKANEALVITGGKGGDGGVKVVIGSGVFVVPFIQRSASISLDATEVPMRVDEGVTSDKIKVTVDAVALAKIDGTPEGVRAAAQRFLGRETEVPGVVATVLAGALRGVVGNMTVEEVLADRAKFATEIKDEAAKALSESGLRIDTLQINAIQSDPSDYIVNLGRPQASAVRRQAEIAEAANAQESAKAQADARIAIAEANKEAALREAQFKKETDAAQAEAAAVGPKVAASQAAEITRAEQGNAEQTATLTKLRLDSDVRAKADAELYAAQKDADAKQYAAQKAADAALYAAEKDAAARAVAVERAAAAERVRLESVGTGMANSLKSQASPRLRRRARLARPTPRRSGPRVRPRQRRTRCSRRRTRSTGSRPSSTGSWLRSR